jgi:hypothetical protein
MLVSLWHASCPATAARCPRAWERRQRKMVCSRVQAQRLAYATVYMRYRNCACKELAAPSRLSGIWSSGMILPSGNSTRGWKRSRVRFPEFPLLRGQLRTPKAIRRAPKTPSATVAALTSSRCASPPRSLAVVSAPVATLRVCPPRSAINSVRHRACAVRGCVRAPQHSRRVWRDQRRMRQLAAAALPERLRGLAAGAAAQYCFSSSCSAAAGARAPAAAAASGHPSRAKQHPASAIPGPSGRESRAAAAVAACCVPGPALTTF